jgi:type I restriction enzyme R subunit
MFWMSLWTLQELKKNPKSQALMMANRVKKHIEVNIKRDEFFYKPISEQIQKALKDYKDGRIDEAKLLATALGERERIKDRDTGKGVPEVIKGRPHAQAFYGIVLGALNKLNIETEVDNVGSLSAKIEDAITDDVTKVDWSSNRDIIKRMKNKVEDLMLDFANEINQDISFETIDFVLEYVIKTAKERFPKTK